MTWNALERNMLVCACACSRVFPARADELLLDLGLLLDMVAVIDEAAAAALQLEDSQQQAGEGGGGAGLVARCGSGTATAAAPAPTPKQPTHQQQLEHELKRSLLAQLSEGGCGGPGSSQLRRHLADVAATLLAGCCALRLAATARFVVAAAAGRLQVCSREELLEAAAEGDEQALWELEALLLLAAPPAGPGLPVLAAAAPQPPPQLGMQASACAGGGTHAHAAERAGGQSAGGVASGSGVPRRREVVAAEEGCNQEVEGEGGGAAEGGTSSPALLATSPSPSSRAGGGRLAFANASGTASAARPGLAQLLLHSAVGFPDPRVERAYWADTARQLRSTAQTLSLLSLLVLVLGSLRALYQDGPAAAIFLVMYLGGQVVSLGQFAARPPTAGGLLAACVGAWWGGAGLCTALARLLCRLRMWHTLLWDGRLGRRD